LENVLPPFDEFIFPFNWYSFFRLVGLLVRQLELISSSLHRRPKSTFPSRFLPHLLHEVFRTAHFVWEKIFFTSPSPGVGLKFPLFLFVLPSFDSLICRAIWPASALVHFLIYCLSQTLYRAFPFFPPPTRHGAFFKRGTETLPSQSVCPGSGLKRLRPVNYNPPPLPLSFPQPRAFFVILVFSFEIFNFVPIRRSKYIPPILTILVPPFLFRRSSPCSQLCFLPDHSDAKIVPLCNTGKSSVTPFLHVTLPC